MNNWSLTETLKGHQTYMVLVSTVRISNFCQQRHWSKYRSLCSLRACHCTLLLCLFLNIKKNRVDQGPGLWPPQYKPKYVFVSRLFMLLMWWPIRMKWVHVTAALDCVNQPPTGLTPAPPLCIFSELWAPKTVRWMCEYCRQSGNMDKQVLRHKHTSNAASITGPSSSTAPWTTPMLRRCSERQYILYCSPVISTSALWAVC